MRCLIRFTPYAFAFAFTTCYVVMMTMMMMCARKKSMDMEGYLVQLAQEHEASASSGVKGTGLPKLAIDVERTKRYFRGIREEQYGNKNDFDALSRLFHMIQELGMGGESSVVLVGGTNEGQGSSEILKSSPNLTFVGFEIQKDAYHHASEVFAMYPNARAINMGWSEHNEVGIQIGGKGELAGLYNPDGKFGALNLQLQEGPNSRVDTTTLANWVASNSIEKVLYVLIDTEGHEPKVIRGMRLEEEENRKKFPLFQYELGGTWGRNDPRHGNDAWSQMDTAAHLESLGYLLFMCGAKDWLAVTSDFFEESDHNPAMYTGQFGPTVQGNLLVVHPQHNPPELTKAILKHSRVEGASWIFD